MKKAVLTGEGRLFIRIVQIHFISFLEKYTKCFSREGLSNLEYVLKCILRLLKKIIYSQVIDTGLADIWGNAKVFSKNSILIFDLKTDKLIHRYEFPDSHSKENSFFANIVSFPINVLRSNKIKCNSLLFQIVDTSKDKCDDAHAYLPDLGGYQVVVYSLKQDKSWCAKHNFFHFDPLQGDFNVQGINFQWTDGTFTRGRCSRFNFF